MPLEDKHSLFQIRHEAVILRNIAGVFTQTTIAVRGKYIYASLSKTRFLQLYADGFTSSPSTRWVTLHADSRPADFGKLVLSE